LIQEKGYDPRRIVAITFTQKAALEMRGRIREAIDMRHIEASDSRSKLFWEQHLKSLEDAYIGTFHGLCGNILRENPIVTGIIPGMRVLSEGEERILLASAAERACVNASHQGRLEDRELFWKAIIQFGLNFFLEQLKSYFPKIRESGLPVSEWVQVREFKLEMTAEDRYSKLQEAVRDILESDARRKATENSQRILRELEDRFNELIPGPSDGFTECASKLKQLKGLLPKNMGRELRPYIDEIHDAADQLLLRESHTEYQKWTGCISRFFELMSEAYSEEKRLQNALDFTDLQLKTRDLLRDKPEIREEIQNRYDYFLVDEFQDTNLLQLEIVRLLTGNKHSKGRLFVVGDAKQSIYRFRGAQVQVVKDLEEELKGRNGQVLPLVENYRCHPAIIDMINHISEATFRDDEITYQGLIAAKNEISSDLAKMRILTSQTNSRTDEAEKLADYIHYIVNIEQPPIDLGDGKSRKLGYGDIALLLRAMTHVEEYTAAFESRGIPFTLGSGSGYYGLQEVLDQLNLIRLIHNSRDAVALLALLRSPYAGLSDADLFWLAEDRGDLLETFYEGDQIPQGLSESSWRRVLRLRRWVGEVQKSRSYLSVSEIIRRAMNDLGYIHVIAAFPGAERSLANLDKLLHKADAYAEVNGRYGIGEFIEYIGNMVAAQEREGKPI
jgi:ATP-dependent helicase/nuclease subunit A